MKRSYVQTFIIDHNYAVYTKTNSTAHVFQKLFNMQFVLYLQTIRHTVAFILLVRSFGRLNSSPNRLNSNPQQQQQQQNSIHNDDFKS